LVQVVLAVQLMIQMQEIIVLLVQYLLVLAAKVQVMPVQEMVDLVVVHTEQAQ
jgi:hypothetical protein